MDSKITKFIHKMHLLSLAVVSENIPYAASCFYAFDEQSLALIVAGSSQTKHINAGLNSVVAGTIALDTKIIAKIEGVQFVGECQISSQDQRQIYFKKFPYAIAMNPEIFSINLNFVKFTSNTLGFGKKLIWQKPQI